MSYLVVLVLSLYRFINRTSPLNKAAWYATIAPPLVENDLYADLVTPCVATETGILREDTLKSKPHRRTYLPIVENSDGRTPYNHVPLAERMHGCGANGEVGDLVLWVQEPNV